MLSSIFRRRNKNTDFESTLNGLSSDVIEHQAKLADIRVRERRASLWITTTLIVIWALYLGFWYLGLVDWFISVDENGVGSGLYKLLAWSGVVVGPFMTLFARRIAKSWYTRIGSQEETRLRDLHTSLVKTLEEVKVKAPYNEARSLLERYGTTVGITIHDVTPSTPTSTPMKAKHLSTPLPSNTPSKASKELPQTPSPGTPSPANMQQMQINKLQPQIPQSDGTLPTTPGKASQQIIPQQIASPVRERKWYDRLADVILGDDPSSTSGDISQRYALICEKCAKHNGLVPREQYIDLQWECRFCQQMNLSPRRKALARQIQGNNGNSNKLKPSPLSQASVQPSEEPKNVTSKEESEDKNEKGDAKPLPLPSKG
ncbi:hypothetical protein WALSEDRAFT_68820 [Wallemia mellicola CBS 633.66]|uniref:Endoplasmic reticulum junction formation protein lunapark n=2 Tax=Wallemia mellicola TaxID=1708541 RepID=A0A4T0M3X9_9BASI|nr:hypothetical protein WALSEDRAFT_68820 [Wallemia mellicola CBS 633.66]TIB77349.1 hypothetical protein E3Q23_01335 [Wallemia mellicola]EIM21918.1 hypothetical protein WALSEDRAFT_68820 [Wallemia mellicola CBS 633.66]TIB89702.1 hypothetical protein E3Q19_02969 [Wallemia mellicola]TIB96701.1 hypothetical protein E3Q18_03017 [Wallemia mellicola]TIC01766.1 hypothetical protein E3Q17_01661 [Wallemia mellicola]|eukprot:XP_006958212.1 hypothetical protein WALSEDRAFT_68820 [Wallemia mellicola CBS 633.66]